MTSSAPEQGTARDTAYWAKAVSTLRLGTVPAEAVNLNVNGKHLAGAIQGFGQLWQRTYRVELRRAEATPAEVVAVWKREFASFWPRRGRFYGPPTAIAPGDVALLNMDVLAGLRLATGIMVLYADDESFTFMNPQGHMFAGWITFSAESREGTTVAQVQILARAGDPLYELAMPLFLGRVENAFWQQTLRTLAARFGVEQATVETTVVRVDRRRQWARFGNLRYNAGIRSTLYLLATPLRLAARAVRAAAREVRRGRIRVGVAARTNGKEPKDDPVDPGHVGVRGHPAVHAGAGLHRADPPPPRPAAALAVGASGQPSSLRVIRRTSSCRVGTQASCSGFISTLRSTRASTVSAARVGSRRRRRSAARRRVLR
jgi:hypothetical protein